MITVRKAEPADAAAMSAVMIASITELCAADHDDNPEIIGPWTGNKAAVSVARWIDQPPLTMLVAEHDGEIAAVGCLTGTDEISLNYVSPNHRFKGVSKALLAAMEDLMRERGADIGKLTSTTTAYCFYRAAGWQDDGPLDTSRRPYGQPMRKRL